MGQKGALMWGVQIRGVFCNKTQRCYNITATNSAMELCDLFAVIPSFSMVSLQTCAIWLCRRVSSTLTSN